MVIVGLNYDVVMMSVGCGLPWDFGVFIWYCDYDVCECVARPPCKYFGVFI